MSDATERKPLTEELLARNPFSSPHETVLREIGRLHWNGDLPRCRVSVDIDWKETHTAYIVPERPLASEVLVGLHHDSGASGAEIGLHVGEGSYFELPWVGRHVRGDLPENVGSAIQAVVAGKLTETIYEVRGSPYKWVCRLPTTCGLLAVDRTSVPDALRGLFRRKHKRVIQYSAY